MSQEMKQIEISKVSVNISEGQVGDGVEKAFKLVKKLTDQEPVRVQSEEEAKSFGLREGLNVGASVTLRGEKARDFLEKILPASDKELSEDAFDSEGNFSLGISEYIDVPGVDYDADIGMKGFEVTVVLERPGYRVKKRNYKPSDIGKDHKVSDEEAKEFVEDELGVEVK